MWFSTIVIGIDFAPLASQAARWVAHTFAPGAELILVHALDLPETPDFLRGRLPSREDHAIKVKADATARLRALADSLGVSGVRAEVREGHPAQVVASFAHEVGAHLIVVGEQGNRRGLLGMGSTAESLLHIAPVPVLLLRMVPEARPETLLVAIDTSATGEAVLAVAADIAAELDARVILQHALSPGLVGRISLISTDKAAAAMENEMIAETGRWLERKAKEAGLDPARIAVHVCFGAPAPEILAASERLENALIVMGSRGAGTVGQMLLGSVASTCARSASCPVLVVTVRD
jgi:nucleotide-binding universal stress UspA family protein